MPSTASTAATSELRFYHAVFPSTFTAQQKKDADATPFASDDIYQSTAPDNFKKLDYVKELGVTAQ